MENTAKKYRSMIIFGAPGIGKGTQAKLLGKLQGFYHFSTGEMFRGMDKNSETGRKISELVDAGNFVPDGLTIELFLQTLKKLEEEKKFDPSSQMLILDGIPRNAKQADMLEDNIEVIKIIYLISSDDDVLAERIQKRAKTDGRSDDNINVLKKRLEIYRKETEAVLKKYPKGIILEVDGFGTIENIYEDIVEKLEAEGLIK